MKRFLVPMALAALFLFACARMGAQEDQYVQVYNMIQDADALQNSGEPAKALSKYLEAQSALNRFQKTYPDWNGRVVSFRLNYLASKISDLSGQVTSPPVPGATVPATNPPTGGLMPGDRTALESQVGALQGQVRQLQSDKDLLQAKLKEALSARPAAVDPAQLAKAEERIRALEKENGLLQVSLNRKEAGAAALPADAQVLDTLKRDLAAANAKISQQTQKADALAVEKQALEARLQSPAPTNSPVLEAARAALEDANRKLAAQTGAASKLTQEKAELEARLSALQADAASLSALQAENRILKKQLADTRRPAAAAVAGSESNRQLEAARAQIAALESDKEIIRLERVALEDRVKQMTAARPAAAAEPAVGSAADAERIQQWERERAELQRKLDAAQKELYGRKRKSVSARIDDLTGQLESLRSRLAVFEAQQVPYTTEELALFKRGQEPSGPASPKTGRASAGELPAGTATLVAEARRDFAAKQFDRAEQKYMQVLQKDENNVYTLANLATIQLQLGHLDDAEKHVQQAIAVNPNDAYSLLILGEIKLKREKYDDALSALSEAAKLDPQNAEIQNYLGLTLSQQGMRQPAETAFRKAIQLQPDYAGAQYNLAVFYITQKPPWPELARWHYQKALDGGFARNTDLEKMLDQGSDRAH